MQLTVKQAAISQNTTTQAIYMAIKKNRLKASRNGRRVIIQPSEFKLYCKSKWKERRKNLLKNGEKVFDVSNGWHSVSETAKLLKCPAQHVYHALRKGFLKGEHICKWHWRIDYEEIIKYKRTMQPLIKRPRMSRGIRTDSDH